MRGGCYSLILEKYNVVKVLSRTAHSAAYLVEHRQLAVYRVAKVVSKESGDYNRVFREANFIKDFKHSGIPLVYDIEEDDVSICIIEEYISGKCLSEYINEGLLSNINQIIVIAVRLCEILEFLHNKAGILHMDIKPENIMICDEAGEGVRITLIDFDGSVGLKEDIKGSFGTVGFAAPEQYSYVCDVSKNYEVRSKPQPQTDVYGVGMLLLYMMENCHIQSDTPKGIFGFRRYSKSVKSIANKCIRHNLSQRYKTITELKLDLFQLLNLSKEAVFTDNNNQIINNKIINRNITDKARNIYVYGSKRGVGVTHFCLCLCSYISRNGKKVVCVRHGDTEDLSALVRVGKLQADGTYKLHNINIMPEYNGCVEYKLEQYDYIIHDFGMVEEGLSDYIGDTQNVVNVYIGDSGYRISDDLNIYKLSEDTIVFINHISGKEFYSFLKNHKGLKSVYRFPWMYEWDKSNLVFEEAVSEALGIRKNKA